MQRHAETVSKKHAVTVLHIISDKNCVENIALISKEINGIPTHIAYIKKTKNPFKKGFLFLSAFKKLLQKTTAFDVVHVHEVFPMGVFSLYLKWFKKKQFIISEHWTDYKYPLSKKIGFIHKFLSKIIVKNATFVCPVTTDLQNSMQIFGLKGRYKIVENVVDTQKFFPITTNNDVYSIVHISNMNDQHKNISGILHVIAKLQKQQTSFNLKVIGENSMQYKNLAKELSIDKNCVSFIDQIPHTEVVTHLQNADLFVLFSNFENLPCVILESFACGTPVIATDVGGISECFPDNFGRLINAKDEDKLLEEILNFKQRKYTIANKKEMYNYIQKNFSEEAICNKFTVLYSKSITN